MTASIRTEKLHGEVSRAIAVESNDAAQPRTQLVIRARILASVQLLPGEKIAMTNRIDWMREGRALVRKDPTESGTLEVDDLQVSVPWLSARATRLTEPRPPDQQLPEGLPGDWLIEVVPAVDPPLYQTSLETVRFKTGLSRQAEVELPLAVDFQPPLKLSTERLELHRGAEGEPASDSLTVSLMRGRQRSELTWEVEPQSMKVTLEPERPPFLFRAQVTIDDPQVREGKVTFRIGQDAVELPVVVVGGGPSAKLETPAGR